MLINLLQRANDSEVAPVCLLQSRKGLDMVVAHPVNIAVKTLNISF